MAEIDEHESSYEIVDEEVEGDEERAIAEEISEAERGMTTYEEESFEEVEEVEEGRSEGEGEREETQPEVTISAQQEEVLRDDQSRVVPEERTGESEPLPTSETAVEPSKEREQEEEPAVPVKSAAKSQFVAAVEEETNDLLSNLLDEAIEEEYEQYHNGPMDLVAIYEGPKSAVVSRSDVERVVTALAKPSIMKGGSTAALIDDAKQVVRADGVARRKGLDDLIAVVGTTLEEKRDAALRKSHRRELSPQQVKSVIEKTVGALCPPPAAASLPATIDMTEEEKRASFVAAEHVKTTFPQLRDHLEMAVAKDIGDDIFDDLVDDVVEELDTLFERPRW